MDFFSGYQCSQCQSLFPPEQTVYVCPLCGGNLNALLDYEAIGRKYQPDDFFNRREASLWRYAPLLPVSFPAAAEQTPLALAGGTPTLALPRLAASLGLETLWLKDESRNPTASFKDRASAIVVARAQELGAETIVTASTGNAGAALAGMAAAIGQKAVIFAPKSAPPAKIAQLLLFGAQVYLVNGSYDDAFDLSLAASREFGWYCRNTGYNPFTLEGKKTAAFEIWEWWLGRLGRGKRSTGELSRTLPAANLTIFVSVGDGNILSGLHKGFKDLQSLGWLGKMPRLVGVQAAGSAAVANAFHAGGEEIQPVHASTLADSISVDLPRDGIRAIRAARETGGTYVTVSDEEILRALSDLGKQGIFAEPAGAAALAGIKTALAQGWLSPSSLTLALNTGSGLKDIRAALQAVSAAPVIDPTLEALRRAL